MIETEVMSNRFIGDGKNKTFAFSFKFNNKNDIQVWLYDSTTNTLTQREDFTLTPNNDTMPSDGGTVTFPSEGAAIPSTQMVIVQRHMNLFQLDVYKHGMFLDLDNFEHSLDTLVLEIQQVADGTDRAIKYPINQTDFDPTLPTLKDGQTIMVNDDGNGWAVIDVKELFDQTHSAWVAADNAAASASTAQKWAESEESPDNQQDEDSSTGHTMSSKSWALEGREQALLATGQADLSKAWAQGTSSPDGNNDEESTTGETQSSRNWALYAKNWAQGETSPDNKDDSDSNTGKTQSAKEWTLDAKDWAMSDESPDNKDDSDSNTDKTMSSKSWALHSRERAAAALTSEQNAAESETNAAQSEQNAAESETNAAQSEQNAAESETNAADSAELADAWAQGTSSPDGNTDTASPTGQTMSARSWVNYMKEIIGESGSTPFSGATEISDGEQGLVPAPLAGQQDHVLKGDGTWGELDIADSAANGLVPIILPIEEDENKSSISYLSPSSGEAEWDNLPYLTSEQDGVVKHYIGSSPSDMYLNANGVFSEIQMPDVFGGATSSSGGNTGTVPAPSAGQQDYVLVGSGEWKKLVDLVHPVGQVLAFSGSQNPNTLFPGTTWAAFAQGRTLVGSGTSDQKFNLGVTGGNSNVTLSTAQIPSHNHTATSSGMSHNHHMFSGSASLVSSWVNPGTNAHCACVVSNASHNEAYVITANNNTIDQGITSNSNGVSSISIGNSGSGQPHNNLQPYVVVNYWVRTQ